MFSFVIDINSHINIVLLISDDFKYLIILRLNHKITSDVE